MTLRGCIVAILDSSELFSTQGSPIMTQRDDALTRLSGLLEHALRSLPKAADGEFQTLNVRKGGRQSSYSPTAWVRVFNPRYAPAATEGFYLVYLFSSDGSRAYLSLNQGTSEFRSGAMRPIRSRDELRKRARIARRYLAGMDMLHPLPRLQTSIDLAPLSKAVGPESHQRTRNYEDANIYAFEYDRAALPSSEDLEADLLCVIPLLQSLYAPYVDRSGTSLNRPPTFHPAELPPGTSRRMQRPANANQGRTLSAEDRVCIELHAEDAAIHHLQTLGWTVTRVGHFRRGYDLECRSAHDELHVEVKGTRSLGEDVILTRNELRHLPSRGGTCNASHDLIVVSSISLDRTPEGPVCSGGDLNHVTDWKPTDEELVATEYMCRVPASVPLRLL